MQAFSNEPQSCITGAPCSWDKPCPYWDDAPTKVYIKVGQEGDSPEAALAPPIATVVIPGKTKAEALRKTRELHAEIVVKESFDFPWYIKLGLWWMGRKQRVRRDIFSLLFNRLCARLLLERSKHSDEVTDWMIEQPERGTNGIDYDGCEQGSTTVHIDRYETDVRSAAGFALSDAETLSGTVEFRGDGS